LACAAAWARAKACSGVSAPPVTGVDIVPLMPSL
jgi:hypothetical protein